MGSVRAARNGGFDEAVDSNKPVLNPSSVISIIMDKTPSEGGAVLWLVTGIVLITVAAAIERAGGLASSNPWIWAIFPFVAICLVVGTYGIYRFFHWGESTGNTSNTYVSRESKPWSALHNYLKDKDPRA